MCVSGNDSESEEVSNFSYKFWKQQLECLRSFIPADSMVVLMDLGVKVGDVTVRDIAGV